LRRKRVGVGGGVLKDVRGENGDASLVILPLSGARFGWCSALRASVVGVDVVWMGIGVVLVGMWREWREGVYWTARYIELYRPFGGTSRCMRVVGSARM
jgi:hypothetical protein